jgi:hypothetical protein
MEQTHITDVETAVRIARERRAHGRAFTFDGREFTEIYPVYAPGVSLPPQGGVYA